MDKKRVEIGDKVTFIFSSGKKLYGVVEHIPAATGDSWIITEWYEGKKLSLVYINQFEMMITAS